MKIDIWCKMRECKSVFKVVISLVGDTEVNYIINSLGVEPGISENFLYYGFIKKPTKDNFFLFEQINDTLSLLLDKKDILIKLKKSFEINYILDIKFSNIEEEIEENTSFDIGNAKEFLDEIGCFINLNDGYFE